MKTEMYTDFFDFYRLTAICYRRAHILLWRISTRKLFCEKRQPIEPMPQNDLRKYFRVSRWLPICRQLLQHVPAMLIAAAIMRNIAR